MLLPRFDETHRQELLRLSGRSLFFFLTAILGLDAFSERLGRGTLAPMHEELCAFLEGRPPFRPWRRAMVCAFRGAGKSVITTTALPLWRALFIQNYSCKIVSNSYENAKKHFQRITNLLMSGDRADFLQWLFSHRIPDNFEGTNSEQLVLVRTDPTAEAAVAIWGTDSAKRGSHSSALYFDDIEGFDISGSSSDFRAARNLYDNSAPLLKEPAMSQVLVVCTPSPDGSPCMAYHLRDSEEADLDNSRRHLQVYWRELLDDHGNSRWPDRYPPGEIELLKLSPSWDTQYMLRRSSSHDTLFDMGQIATNYYTKKTVIGNGRATWTLNYPHIKYDPAKDAIDNLGQLEGKTEWRQVGLGSLRHFVHFDPLHRTKETRRTTRNTRRPASAGIVVVGVAEDGHAFAVRTWKSREADLTKQAEQCFHFYCQFCAHLVSFEGVGAQIWFISHVLHREKFDSRWARPRSLPGIFPVQSLPPMSTRLIEATKSNEAKESEWRDKLIPFLATSLHLSAELEELIAQLRSALDENAEVDLIDALSQGCTTIQSPNIDGTRRSNHGKLLWSRPLPREVREHLGEETARRRMEAERSMQRFGAGPTGISRPWGAPIRKR